VPVKFTLKAPDEDNLEEELGGDGEMKFVDLAVEYAVYSDMDDPCLQISMLELSGQKYIPYRVGRNAVISNRNVTNTIIRQ